MMAVVGWGRAKAFASNTSNFKIASWRMLRPYTPPHHGAGWGTTTLSPLNLSPVIYHY